MQAELHSIRFRSNPLCAPVLDPCRSSCPIITVDGLFSLLDSTFYPTATLSAPPAVMMMTVMHMYHARLDRRSAVPRLYPPDLSRKKSLNKQSGLRCYKVLIFSQIRQMVRGGFLSFIYEHVMVCEGYGYLGSDVPRQADSASRSFCILFCVTFLFLFLLPYSSSFSGWVLFLCLSLRFFLIYLEYLYPDDIYTNRVGELSILFYSFYCA